ncbi:MAG: nucleoside kinase [Anaerolineae bacterium]|nr:nucleoside kinase [Anaerolineae bacterium]
MKTTLSSHIQVQQVQPRPTVEIHLPDGRVFSGPRGATAEQFLMALPEWHKTPIIAVVVNSELHELTHPILVDAYVKPITLADTDGARIYRRSLTFLLEAAFEQLFPELSLSVTHTVASGGFFCEVEGKQSLTHQEIKLLEKKMGELVSANLPFHREEVPLDQAIAYFEAKGAYDKVRLLKYRQKKHLVLYSLGDHRDYHHGYMVPSSGYLRWFDLTKMGDGFVLRFPRRHLPPSEFMPVPESPKLLETFQQYRSWLNSLGISSIGALNDAITDQRIREVVLMSEALHEQKIAEIASRIASSRAQTRIILIAGPSSSGKTTFSKRLAIQLLARGISPFALEMDNYFVDRVKTPRDANGEYDYEALEALDTNLLSLHLKRLIAGEEVQLRRYDFKTGSGVEGDTVRLSKDQLIILEGIHGLNPRLLPDIPSERTFRIYVSCLTQLNLDRHNKVSTTDARLVRRIVRDARERGYSAQETLNRWESVRRGEKLHIFPYQDFADEMFNSALVYEMCCLKPLVEPLLRQVPYGTAEYIEAKRLLAFLEWFLPFGDEIIPDNSILREFIGGSILAGFKIWKNV